MQTLYPSMLRMAMQRGWLTPLAARRVEALIEEGLHPEQVLVGTGLLSRDRYAECLSEASGLPFVDAVEAITWDGVVEDAALLAQIREAKMVLFQQEGVQLTAGSARPEFTLVEAIRQRLVELGFELNLFCIFEAAWRKSAPSSLSVPPLADTVVRLSRLIQAARTGIFTVFESKEGIHATEAHYPSLSQSTLVARVPWTRVASLLERQLSRIGWKIEERLAYAPRGFVLRRMQGVKDAHPVDWPSRIQDFLRKPQGVLAFVDSDAEIKQKFRFPFEMASATKEGHRAQETLWIEVHQASEQEQAIQFALMGKPLVIFTDRPAWLQVLRQGHVPVSIVHAHLTPQGRAWQISHE